MSPDRDDSETLCNTVREACAHQRPLSVVGSGSKDFLGAPGQGDPLAITGHTGLLRYRPEELVVTARAGTPLRWLAELLAEHDQMLPFEPPEFAGGGTLGGAIGAGLSGPGRPWLGALRDAVLGVEMVNGLGQRLSFGGEVMKNVAGYDISRLMAGSFGTLGLILSASIRTRPRPSCEATVGFEATREQGLAKTTALGRSAGPVTATCQNGERLSIRLSGSEQDVAEARRDLGGEPGDLDLWLRLRDHREAFFSASEPSDRRYATSDPGHLWRLSVPFAVDYPNLAGEWLTEWGGAQRWLISEQSGESVRAAARAAGGHATCFSSGADPFMPLRPELLDYHQRLKFAFDPHGIFNRGRMYGAF